MNLRHLVTRTCVKLTTKLVTCPLSDSEQRNDCDGFEWELNPRPFSVSRIAKKKVTTRPLRSEPWILMFQMGVFRLIDQKLHLCRFLSLFTQSLQSRVLLSLDRGRIPREDPSSQDPSSTTDFVSAKDTESTPAREHCFASINAVLLQFRLGSAGEHTRARLRAASL